MMNNIIILKDRRKKTTPTQMSTARYDGCLELIDGTTIPIKDNMLLYCLYNVTEDTLQFIEEFTQMVEGDED